MRKIILANNQEYEITRCGAADDVLWIGFPAGVINMAEAVRVFSDDRITRYITSTYDFNGMDTYFDGYVELIQIQKETDGGIIIALHRAG